MKNKIVLFFSAFILVGLFVFYIAKSEPKEKPQPTPKPQISKAAPTKAPQKKQTDALINVDYINASLDTVATFVATVSKKGIVFNGQEAVLLSWMQQDIKESALFNAFQTVLGSYNLTMRPLNAQSTAFEIVRLNTIPVPVRLDFAWSKRGLFLMYNGVIYPYEKFPYPLRQANGSWFALIPSNQATPPRQKQDTSKATTDHLATTKQPEQTAM